MLIQTLNNCIDVANQIAVEAFYSPKNTKNKSHNVYDVVTDTDIHIEDEIVKIIKEAHPDHNILAEERNTQNRDNEYTWIIDPIDGTANFANNNPNFTISIALTKNGEVVMGSVSSPIYKEVFTAEKGKGLFVNNVDYKNALSVREVNHLRGSIISGCLTDFDAKKAYKKYGLLPRSLGSAALELAWLAVGRIHGVFYNKISPWDIAAGIILVTEGEGTLLRFSDNLAMGHCYAVHKNLETQYKDIFQDIIIPR